MQCTCSVNIKYIHLWYTYYVYLRWGTLTKHDRELLFGHGNTFDRGLPVVYTISTHVFVSRWCAFFIDCQSLRELRIVVHNTVIAACQKNSKYGKQDSSAMVFFIFSLRGGFNKTFHFHTWFPWPLPPPPLLPHPLFSPESIPLPPRHPETSFWRPCACRADPFEEPVTHLDYDKCVS
jgi:hypothetical protein